MSQASLRRLKELGIRPKRSLGQNFLIDDNFLGLIGSYAELSDADVVLEVGGGLGVLSEYLASRAKFLHVYEIDERLRPAIEEAVGARENVSVIFADAVRVEFQQLSPKPTKMISNLPYSIATTVILRTMQSLESIGLWVVMVQKEIADRLSASPGIKAYGAPSVLAQLVCKVEKIRSVPRTVFAPSPNVDSALLKLVRVGPPLAEKLRLLINASFAHRRKALPRSLYTVAKSDSRLSDAFGFDPEELRSLAKRSLVEIGEPDDARAERLVPAQFVELEKQIGGQ